MTSIPKELTMSRSSTSIRAVLAGILTAAALVPANAAALEPSATSAPLPATTTPATATPIPAPATPDDLDAPQARDAGPLVPLAYMVDGAAQVRTGIRGSVSISGTFTGAYDPADGAITGDFKLTPTRAHVTALGFLPVVAETDWSFTRPVEGSWKDGVLRMRIAAKIRHPRMWLFGIQVAGGPQCATREASIIDLAAPADPVAAGPQAGGTLTSVAPGFTISALEGCGPLTGFLSAVAAGGGNQTTLTFTERPAA